MRRLSSARARLRLRAEGVGDRIEAGAVGAVVIGGDYQGLGIVRSLGRLRVPVCVVDDQYSIARFSRHIEHSVRVRDLRDEQRAVDALLGVGRHLGLKGWVLFPTRDETVAALSRHRDVLSEFFRVPTPGWKTVRWAWDKRNTYQLASELGIPTPRTWNPRDLNELRGIDAEPPLVIKPAVKEHFVYTTKDKAWRVDNREELERRFATATRIVEPGEVMIQELIPGDGRHQFAYCALFKDGQAVGRMVARRGRQHPPEFGRSSTFVETVDVPELETLSERFLREIDYYGLVELEYKLDAREGRYKLLDVNARTWGYHSIGARSGVDFAALLFADQLGRPVEACRARVGVRWVRFTTDVPTAAVMLFKGHLDWRSYLRSLKGFDVEGTFTRDDPVPGLVELALIPYLALKRGF
jgi:predicted ATP-grasp superfamily ATP-dependent carboligase